MKESEDLKAIIYTGPSMNPTLQNLDKLFHTPYKDSKINIGDIVVFLDTKRKIKVIHRVKSADSRGIETMGDNNSHPDPMLLRPDQIIGRIIYGERNNKNIRIFNGSLGNIQAILIRWKRSLNKYLYNILKSPYYLLSGKLNLPVRKKMLIFQRAKGKELQIVIGRVVIARQLPGEEWQVRPPFRMFLDKSILHTEINTSRRH